MCGVEGKRNMLYLSMRDEVAAVGLDGVVQRRALLAEAGALCVGKESLYCADASGVVWKLDRRLLLPQGMMTAGPGVCDLALSGDGTRLYALLADADSMVMLDARHGRPLLLNRCGCNPAQLALRDGVLAAAGGQSECVHLYDADTLVCRKNISMPGPVYAVSLGGNTIYALCMTAQLNTILVAQRKGHREALHLDGMPGALAIGDDRLYALTQGWLYVFEAYGLRLIARCSAPGRASCLCVWQGQLVMLDALTESAYIFRSGRGWRLLGEGVKGLDVHEA